MCILDGRFKDRAAHGRRRERAMDGKELRAQFERPGSAYRGKPFWSWNGELEKGELLR